MLSTRELRKASKIKSFQGDVVIIIAKEGIKHSSSKSKM